MESFKSISDYPGNPCPMLSSANLARYDDYMRKVIEESRRNDLAAREWASKNFIQFHTR